MRIEYSLTFEDLKSFYQFDRWFSDERKFYRTATRIAYGLALPIVLIIVLLCIDSKIQSPVGIFLLLIFLFVSGYLSSQPAELRKWEVLAKRVINDKMNSGMFVHTAINFTPQTISWKSEVSEGEVKSESIKKVNSDDNYYYLYNTTLTAWIIPKRVFLDSDQRKEFEEIIKHYGHHHPPVIDSPW